MKATDVFLFVLSGIAIGMFIVMLLTKLIIEPREYKQGQVDALTGKVKYELVTQSDSTRIWKEIK